MMRFLTRDEVLELLERIEGDIIFLRSRRITLLFPVSAVHKLQLVCPSSS